MTVSSAVLVHDVLASASDVSVGIAASPTGFICRSHSEKTNEVGFRQHSISVQRIGKKVIFLQHVQLRVDTLAAKNNATGKPL